MVKKELPIGRQVNGETMAIDYVIDYDCIPKQHLGTEGIIERLKGEERARAIIELFRKNGDDRPPSEMGFEFTRATPTGEEEVRVIVVQDLLDEAEKLDPLRPYCAGCPANRAQRPFGCIGFIQYPLSSDSEAWMLDQLPVPDDTLVWLLLRQGVEEFDYDGSSVQPLRSQSEVYFEARDALKRRLGEFQINADQLFEMLFSVGHLSANHAALLLLFLNAIPRDLDADAIMHLSPPPPDANERLPFLLKPEADDDHSISELKEFLRSLYIAWRLNVRTLLDV
ncbi:MAG: hypothetical protein SF029_19565 [bacterium]|nr:hypothetical protein [bacterium]